MTRWLGALLLAAGTAALGLGAVWSMEQRVRDLRGIIAGLYAMERALKARLAPLEEMLAAGAEGADGRAGGFFLACREEMKRSAGGRFAPLWEAALETVPLCLDKDDLNVIRRLGSVLGRYDSASQSAAILRTAAELEGRLSEAAERRGRLGRVYGALGISAGLFLVILLF